MTVRFDPLFFRVVEAPTPTERGEKYAPDSARFGATAPNKTKKARRLASFFVVQRLRKRYFPRIAIRIRTQGKFIRKTACIQFRVLMLQPLLVRFQKTNKQTNDL